MGQKERDTDNDNYYYLLDRSEVLDVTDDQLAERLNKYIGRKERDTDKYCW